jgi:hypothetical protein
MTSASPIIVRHSVFRANQAVHNGSITATVTVAGGAIRVMVGKGPIGFQPGSLRVSEGYDIKGPGGIGVLAAENRHDVRPHSQSRSIGVTGDGRCHVSKP